MTGIQFHEVHITLRGVDEKGKRKVFKLKHKIAPLTSVHMTATRPGKLKKGRIKPSEFVFHTMDFVTGV